MKSIVDSACDENNLDFGEFDTIIDLENSQTDVKVTSTPKTKSASETIKQVSVNPQQHERKNSLTSEEQKDTPEDAISGENETDKIDIVN